MSNVPLMPMATAVWLVENTTLTFKQIAKFCNLHEVEVQGIADGEVAKGIMAYNPIISGQLTREEIELASKDENKELQIKNTDIEISTEDKKIKKYIPLSKTCPSIVERVYLGTKETCSFLRFTSDGDPELRSVTSLIALSDRPKLTASFQPPSKSIFDSSSIP